LWSSNDRALANHWTTPVCYNGYLYCIGGQAQDGFGTAPLTCVNITNGRVEWSHPGFGPGGVTLVDGHVLVLSDKGDLVLVKAAQDGYHESARAHVLSGKCWNYAAVSGGRIYARSTRQGVCIDVSPGGLAAN